MPPKIDPKSEKIVQKRHDDPRCAQESKKIGEKTKKARKMRFQEVQDQKQSFLDGIRGPRSLLRKESSRELYKGQNTCLTESNHGLGLRNPPVLFTLRASRRGRLEARGFESRPIVSAHDMSPFTLLYEYCTFFASCLAKKKSPRGGAPNPALASEIQAKRKQNE